MSKILKTVLSESIDENERRSTARALQALLVVVLIASIVSLIVAVAGRYGLLLSLPLFILIISDLISLALMRRGMLLPARILLPATLYVAITFIVAIGYGLHDIDMIAFAGVIAIAGLTLGQNAVLIFGGLIVLSIFGIGIAEMQGLLASPTRSLTNLISPINISIVVLAIAFVQRILIQRLNESIQRARQNEQKQILANQALEEERANLEARVKERTQDLERRAIQLHAAAEVGNVAAASQDLDTLLSAGTRLLSARFGFYHVAIFLNDDSGEYAFLRAANSEGGQRMLRRKHKLEIGQVGIVGYVAESGRARIALDVGQDAVYFDNPDLPSTRSEMALPLKVADRILGVLDIQSTEPQAFKQDDIEVLQVVADQLAVAIENSRLLAESQSAAEAVRRAYGEASLQAWKRRFAGNNVLTFKSNEKGNVVKVDTEQWLDEEQQAVLSGVPIKSKSETALYVPLLQRGQAIGVIKLVKHDESRWSDDEVQLIQTLAAQLSDSLEAARLYDDAQNRAEREQAITNISTKISSVYNINDILRSMTEELGKMLEDSEVVVQLTSREDDHA
jgi:GAF domain-containing protein